MISSSEMSVSNSHVWHVDSDTVVTILSSGLAYSTGLLPRIGSVGWISDSGIWFDISWL